MKVALIYDFLNAKWGGGERVFMEIADLFPEAAIYTLLYDDTFYGGRFGVGRVRTSYLQRLPAFLRKRTRYLLPLIPSAIEGYDLSGYDVVISVSSGYSKSVITRPETLHICYCYSPTRAFWDYWPRYINEQFVGPVRRAAIHILTSRLRVWDYYSAQRVDRWVAISQTVADRIAKYYRQPGADIVFPSVETAAFKPINPDNKQDYFVTLATLTPYKKIDMAVVACTKMGEKLVVIGDGPDRGRLEAVAGPTIKFAGRVDDNERERLLTQAKAMIFPNEEDFGIAPIEAMAAGTPVIAYAKGGVTETVVAGKTGTFFTEPTVDSLIQVIKTFKSQDYNLATLTDRAKSFDRAHFRTTFTALIQKAYGEHVKAD